ncbi:MAG: hypothetical protein FIA95_05755 [Gemmatimonadetes bacterium]|nr:hypothetical protein [Gemmatimonadota bacterium]
MRATHRMRQRGRLPLLVCTLALAGCTTAVRQGPDAGLVAQLSLERFLQAANARDLEGMARLFGTASGPAWDTGSTFACTFKKIGSWFGGTACAHKRDVEVRMDAIAQILRHDDYRIVREEPVAGRMTQATRVYVDLTVNGQAVSGVPFVLVRAGGGRWLVEEVALERVMRSPRRTPGGR